MSFERPPARSNQPNVHESKLLDNPDGWHGAELSVVIAGGQGALGRMPPLNTVGIPAWAWLAGRQGTLGVSFLALPCRIRFARRQLVVLPRQCDQVPAADCGHHAVRAGGAGGQGCLAMA